MRYLMALAVLGTAASPILAQSPVLAGQGQPVWVRGVGSNGKLDAGVKGTLEGMSGDTLLVRSGDHVIPVVPGDSTRVMVRMGRHSRTGHGAAVGALIGGLTGTALGMVAAGSCNSGDYYCPGSQAIPAAALGGALWGLAIGALIGSVSHREEWAPMATASARPLLRPAEGGVGVGVSIAF